MKIAQKSQIFKNTNPQKYTSSTPVRNPIGGMVEEDWMESLCEAFDDRILFLEISKIFLGNFKNTFWMFGCGLTTCTLSGRG